VKLRFLAAPPQHKSETASPDTLWIKLLAKYPFSIASSEAFRETIRETIHEAVLKKAEILFSFFLNYMPSPLLLMDTFNS
jgi:hypothetical protein